MLPPFRPRIRTLLLFVNLIVLLLPVGAIYGFHLYESELIRQTEESLINQGGLLASLFAREIENAAQQQGIAPEGNVLDQHSRFNAENKYLQILPRLDSGSVAILPTAPSGVAPDRPPAFLAQRAGQAIQPVLHDAIRITLTGVRIVDHHGIVVASSGTENDLFLGNREEVRLALQGEYASLLRERVSDEPAPSYSSISRSSDFRVFVALPVVVGDRIPGAVVLSRSPLSRGEGLYLLRSQLLQGALVVIVLAVLFSIVATFIISAPMKTLVRQAEGVRQGRGDAAQPLRYPGTEEAAELSESIVQMARTLEARAGYIKTFAGNVSHEFKTPLSSLQGSVELLQNYGCEMGDAERETFLGNMQADVARLSALVRRLLELARADVVSPGTAASDVETVFVSLKNRYKDSGQVRFVARGGHCTVNMDHEILESILVNMIDNGLQHGGAGTVVTVSAQRKSPGVEVLVSDTGAGISEGNRHRIFQHFFTTARDSGGSGLGLTIVRSLLAAHNGTIELLEETEETTFRICLQSPAPG